MASKKSTTPSKRDRLWQQKIEKKTRAENVKLNHLKGKERFEQALKEGLRKSST